MALETGTWVDDLVVSNPVGASDQANQGDDHLRLIKSVLKTTFPNATRAFYFETTKSKSANYTITTSDARALILCDTSAGGFTVTLPTAASAGAGFTVTLCVTTNDTNILTIDGSGAETINGVAQIFIKSVYTAVRLWTDGSEWYGLYLNEVTSDYIERLTNLTGTGSAANDQFIIRDTSDTSVKSITRTELVNAILAEQFPGQIVITAGGLDVTGNIVVSGTVDGVDLAALATANTGDEVAATTTTAGIVEKATTAEMNAGTADKFPDAAAVKAFVPLEKKYASSEQTITTAGLLTLAHGLGARPSIITGYLKCLTAEANYSIGDYVYVPLTGSSGVASGKNNHSAVYADATNINIRFGDDTKVFAVCDKTTGSYTELTNGNWGLYVEAFA